ncbi:hypothetical protein HNQ02_001154 [Flavobacterium sp. 7E]|uniref:2TM domain-containing protein n=1 Tax=unclassified Flavobacterium TaxID=196869 RepID=UPI0015701F10|nr:MULTISPECIES: 2TM domain-containing protein [unclassified Flavobacterium]MBE0390495.1 hypothetical protein [Flavobacterium sp. PL002]NRS88240.1 hypothetical protein [Flavobacterium sp. 7E]
MGRYRRSKYDNYRVDQSIPDNRYNMAYKRMKRIKGFYIHLLIYVLINGYHFASVLNRSIISDGVFLRWETWSTLFFWGIGLAAHGLSVFGRDLFFGSNWEQKKIQEFMNKDTAAKWE